MTPQYLSRLILTHPRHTEGECLRLSRLILSRLEELAERSRQVEDALALNVEFQTWIMRRWGLSSSESAIIEHLTRKEVLAIISLTTILATTPEALRVFMTRLRRKTGLTIKNHYGVGYSLPDRHKIRLQFSERNDS